MIGSVEESRTRSAAWQLKMRWLVLGVFLSMASSVMAWNQPYANDQHSSSLNQASAFPKTLAWNQSGNSGTIYVSSAQTVSLNGSEYASQASLDGRLRLVTVQTGALAWEAHENGGILGYPSFDDSGLTQVWSTRLQRPARIGRG